VGAGHRGGRAGRPAPALAWVWRRWPSGLTRRPLRRRDQPAVLPGPSRPQIVLGTRWRRAERGPQRVGDSRPGRDLVVEGPSLLGELEFLYQRWHGHGRSGLEDYEISFRARGSRCRPAARGLADPAAVLPADHPAGHWSAPHASSAMACQVSVAVVPDRGTSGRRRSYEEVWPAIARNTPQSCGRAGRWWPAYRAATRSRSCASRRPGKDHVLHRPQPRRDNDRGSGRR
jgi:hypothetical protein